MSYIRIEEGEIVFEEYTSMMIGMYPLGVQTMAREDEINSDTKREWTSKKLKEWKDERNNWRKKEYSKEWTNERKNEQATVIEKKNSDHSCD